MIYGILFQVFLIVFGSMLLIFSSTPGEKSDADIPADTGVAPDVPTAADEADPQTAGAVLPKEELSSPAAEETGCVPYPDDVRGGNDFRGEKTE